MGVDRNGHLLVLGKWQRLKGMKDAPFIDGLYALAHPPYYGGGSERRGTWGSVPDEFAFGGL